MVEILTDQIFEDIVKTIREPLLVLDHDLKVISVSRSFYDFFKVNPEETVGQLIYDLGNKQWDIPKLRELLETILPQKTTFDDYAVEHDFATIGRRVMLLNARQIERGEGEERIILLAIEDITERKKIEAGLEKTRKELEVIKKSADEAHEFADSVINTVREPLISLDQNLRVVTVSRSFYEFFKVKPEETVGQLIYDLGNKQWDIPRLRELLETILPEKTSFDNYEVEHDFATIGKRTMLLNARQIERGVGEERIILLAIEDITERKQLEDGIKDSLELYRKVFETSTDGILLFEKGGLTIRHANPALKAMLGYSQGELVGKELKDIGFPKDIGSYQEIMQTLEEFGILHYKEARIEKKTGQLSDTDIYMVERANLIQCNLRDISERKRVEKTLREGDLFITTLLDSLPIPVSYKNREGKYLGCNRSFEQFYKRDRIDIIGKSVYDMGPEEIAEKHNRMDMELLDNPGIQSYVWKVLNGAGELRDVIFYKSTFEDGDGKVVGLIGGILDITERKRAEEETTKLQAQLQQSQKMEAIGTLAGGIAHDFNNILSAVIGYTELAQMKLGADSEIKDDLKEVLTAGVRAKDLVKQIMTFSRQTKEEKMPVQVGLIVTEALKLIRSSLPTIIDIRQNILSKSIVLSDPTQFHQIVMNLCTNAAHAMQEKGGILEVTLTDVMLDSNFVLTYPEILPGAYQKLTVSDTGHGITPEAMNRIFDPFFTTKSKDQGTGLGLSVVHGIVKDYGGTITVYSEPDKGTTFNLYFPIIEGKAGERHKEDTIIPTGTERILVVDDEKAIIDIIKRTLTSLGYVVEARTSSLEALELFKVMPDKFDLFITDMTMPQMTGDKLALELIKIRPDIPVILCTGFSENVTQERADTIGIKAFLLKPLLREEMAHTIRKVLDEAKGSTQ